MAMRERAWHLAGAAAVKHRVHEAHDSGWHLPRSQKLDADMVLAGILCVCTGNEEEEALPPPLTSP